MVKRLVDVRFHSVDVAPGKLSEQEPVTGLSVERDVHGRREPWLSLEANYDYRVIVATRMRDGKPAEVREYPFEACKSWQPEAQPPTAAKTK